MWSKDELEERKRKARRILQSLRKLNREGFVFLLRTQGNGTFGGIVYHIEKVNVPDLPIGQRTVFHLILPDGREAKEYADYYDGSTLHDAIILSFPDTPFALTMRTRPTLTDEDDDMEWMIHGARAEPLATLKSELQRRNEEIEELWWMLEQKERRIKSLEREVALLREKVRDYEAELDKISEEKVQLESELRRIMIIAQKHMAGELEAHAAVKEILARAEQAGKWEVMGVRDKLLEFLKKEKEISELVQIVYPGGNGQLPSRIEKMLEMLDQKIRELDEREARLRETEERVKALLERLEKAKPVEAKAEVGV